MLQLIIISFFAGIMTVLAPCILPLLPVVVGGSLTNQKVRLFKSLVITSSLALSVVVFTLVLKLSTSLLSVPPQVWQFVSGAIVILLGITLVWPKLWEPIAVKLSLKSNQLLIKSGASHNNFLGDFLTGAALGPVFASCSPVYAFIVAGVLPASFFIGLLYLIAYALGLSITLLLISLIGQKLVARLQWASNPRGWLKRTIGIIFILVGLFVATGLDKRVQAYLVENGWYDSIAEFEQSLVR